MRLGLDWDTWIVLACDLLGDCRHLVTGAGVILKGSLVTYLAPGLGRLNRHLSVSVSDLSTSGPSSMTVSVSQTFYMATEASIHCHLVNFCVSYSISPLKHEGKLLTLG